MLNMALFSEFLKFENYLDLGIDAAIYFMLAMVATFFFLVYLGMQLIGIGGADLDVEMGGMDAGAHFDSTGAFTVFSLLSILAFFMGSGWMGLACRVSWNMDPLPSSFAATGFGFGLMMLSSGLMYAVRKMAREAKYDVATAIGRTGKVYLTIPAKGKGRGQVQVNVSGRLKIISASTQGEEIPAFTAVTVVSVEDDQSVVVEVKS